MHNTTDIPKPVLQSSSDILLCVLDLPTHLHSSVTGRCPSNFEPAHVHAVVHHLHVHVHVVVKWQVPVHACTIHVINWGAYITMYHAYIYKCTCSCELKLVKCMLVKLGRMHYLTVSHCWESWSVCIVFLKRRTWRTTLSSPIPLRAQWIHLRDTCSTHLRILT